MNRLVQAYDWASLSCFVLMMSCVLLEVVTRNIIMVPTTWVEELSRLLFIYTVFLGAASAWYRGTHIIIDVLPRRLEKRPRLILKLAVECITGILMLCITGGTVYMMTYNYDAVSTALEISLAYFYLGIFLGVGGIVIIHSMQILYTIRELALSCRAGN